MNKLLRYSFVALLAMIAGSAFAESIIWQEDFSSYAKDDIPQGTNSETHVYYSCQDGGSKTKIYAENLAGGTAPELLVSKSNGEFDVVIPLTGQSGEMTLSFKTNQTLTVSSTSENVTVGEITKTGNDCTCTITTPEGLGRLHLNFKNTSTKNARLDDIKLYQGTAKKAAGLSFGTSARTVTIGAADNVFPTLTNTNNLSVTYDSSEKTVATIAADGTITLVAAGSTVISATSEETAEFAAGHAQYTLTVKEASTTPTEIEEITVSKALELANALADNGYSTVEYKIKGFVVGTPAIDKKADGTFYGNAKFYMADEKGGTNTIYAYQINGLNNEKMDSEDYLKENDEVTVQGKLQKYVKSGTVTLEIAKGGFLTSLNRGATTTTYKITITNTEHGNITLDKYEAAAGEKVNVTGMTTAEGWQMEPPTITDANGNAVEIQGGDGGYYIIMPASNITIALNFIQLFKITIANYDKNMGDVTGISFNSQDDPIYKKAGKNVEFTVTAKQGFKIESVTVVDEDKNPISVAPNERNIYQFEMPAKNVTITAVFSGSVADTWTVAGTQPLTDKTWDPTDPNGDMTPDGNGVGVSSYERNDIVLEKGINYEFKVVKNHAWGEEYPEKNYVITVDETAKYHVKIFFNTTTHEVFHEINKTGEGQASEKVYSVIGDINGSWDTDTDMTKGEDGLYKAVFTNVAEGTYKFKVRVNHDWGENYGGGDDKDGNSVITVTSNGSTVTVTFNAETKAVKAIISPATGIATAKIVNMNNTQLYNVAGQKVTSSYKGLVIVNGKKMIQK